MLVNEEVDFRTHAEVGQIQRRFNGKTGPRYDGAIVVRFGIVHVSTGSVDFASDGMASTMPNILLHAALAKVATDGVVDFKPARRPDGRPLPVELSGCRYHGADDGGKRLNHTRRHNLSTIGHPCDVVIYGLGVVQFGPKVEQYQIATSDLCVPVEGGQ